MKKKRTPWRQGLSACLALLLCLTLLPAAAFADGTEDTPDSTDVPVSADIESSTPVTFAEESGSADNADSTDIEINEENFPDEDFRSFVRQYDGNSNDKLSQSELDAVKTMDCHYKSITDLKGIEHFTKLTTLQCYANHLTTLDLSNLTELRVLGCSSNQLTSLDLSKNTELTTLECQINKLSTLNIRNCTKLTELNCHHNQLTELDVSNNTKLTKLECWGNKLTTLDVSNLTELCTLSCASGKDSSSAGNQISTLTLTNTPKLTYLYCNDNKLTTLDVSNNPALDELYCKNNQLTELDVSNNSALTDLDCRGNQLTTLDVSNNTNLWKLRCDNNQLTALNLEACPVGQLSCQNNQYPITVDSTRQFDLTSLKQYGLNASRMNILSGGTVTGNILTVDSDATKVTYEYDVTGDGYYWTYHPFTLVVTPPTCSLSQKDDYQFPTLTYGYDTVSPHSITITNIGEEATKELTVTVSTSSFEASERVIPSIPVGGSATFTVQPVSGLTPGDYTGTVTVSAGHEQYRFQVSQTVETAGQVAAPVISPNGGAFDQTLDVTLSCATPGATIYYTIDGSDVNANSLRYTGPITLTENTTIKARAMAEYMDASETVTAEFTKNSAPDPDAPDDGDDPDDSDPDDDDGDSSDKEDVVADYTLTFQTNGGSKIAKLTTAKGTKVNLKKYKTTRDGYQFTGWYSDEALTNQITSVKLTKNTTVYAGWKAVNETDADAKTNVPKTGDNSNTTLWLVLLLASGFGVAGTVVYGKRRNNAK